MKVFFVTATWLDVLAIAACAGLLACQAWVAPKTPDGTLRRAIWSWLGWAAVLITVSSLLMLISRTMEMSGASFTGVWKYLLMVTMKTHYGIAWQVRMGAVIVLWLAWGAGRLPSLRNPALAWYAVALAVIAYTRSATGHAGARGMFLPAVWIDWLHVLAGGVWVGSLLAWALIIFPTLLRNESLLGDVAGRRLAVNAFGRLSTASGIALAVVVLSGIYSAWMGLGKIDALWLSGYGQILVVKVMFIAWMVYLGGHNRYVKLPHLDQWAEQSWLSHPLVNKVPGFRPWPYRAGTGNPVRRCARAVNIQAFLGVAVLAAAALLHHAMPPADMHHLQAQASLGNGAWAASPMDS